MSEYMQFFPASDFVWPLAYRFHISGPFGGSQLELCVNAPKLWEYEDGSKRLAPLLWYTAIAPAMTTAVTVDFVEMVAFNAGLTPIVFGGASLMGVRTARGHGRDTAGVLGMHTGHHDKWGLKRFYAAGMPRSWAQDGQLTVEGASRLQEVARGWIAGMGIECNATDPVLLVRARQVIPVPGPMERVDGFRYVRHVRVLQHTAPVPEPGNLTWP